MANYLVYDSRAEYDIDAASVLECFEAKNDKKAKKHYLKSDWAQLSTVLCDFDDNVLYISR